MYCTYDSLIMWLSEVCTNTCLYYKGQILLYKIVHAVYAFINHMLNVGYMASFEVQFSFMQMYFLFDSHL